jgi:hypothetical protein
MTPSEDAMGALRWTGKAFQFVGKILTAEEFEAWVEAEGKDLLRNQIEKLAFKGVAGRARAKRALRKEVIRGLEQSTTLRTALTQALDALPGIVLHDAKFMRDKKAKTFHAMPEWNKYVVAVPRVLPRNDLRHAVIGALKQSAELARFSGLPEIFLERKADAAEAAFFDGVRSHDPIVIAGGSAMILAVDANFDWKVGLPRGHYYVAVSTTGLVDLTKRKDRKQFQDEVRPALVTLQAQLGAVADSELAAFRESFQTA